MGKSLVEIPLRLRSDLPRLRDRKLLVLDRTRFTRLRMAPWKAWPMPATTRTGVPRASAHGLQKNNVSTTCSVTTGGKERETYGFLLPRMALKAAKIMPKMAMSEPTCSIVQVDQ